MELLFTSRWYILIIIILVIPSLCIKKRESVKEYRVDEILEDGHFSNLPNGDPIYIVNVKKHEFKKIKAINDFFVQGNTITDKGKNFEYKILDQMYRLPDEVKDQKWFRLKIIDLEEKHSNNTNIIINTNNTNIINNINNISNSKDITIRNDIDDKNYENIINIIEDKKQILIEKGIPSEEIEELKSNRSKKLIFNFVKKFSEILVEVGIKAIIEKYYS